MILDPLYECADQTELMRSVIKPQLSSLFLKVYNNFSYYRWKFDEAGIDLKADPIEILDRLQFMTKHDYSMLERDAISHANKLLYHMETTSGSTGRPKRRFESRTDELNELRLAMRVFAGFDISKDDVVTFMDVGNPSIYLWFAKALEALGIKETIYYGVQSDFNSSIKKLADINPTVIVTVPSLLERSFDTISQLFANKRQLRLKKIIYFGEKLNDRFKSRIEDKFKVEIFSHYGATETSTLGGECHIHDGIHIYNDYNLPTLVDTTVIDQTTVQGEVAWTTMLIDVQPVIKYRLGDILKINYSPCKCGRTSPRAKIVARTSDCFSLYGEKFYYDTFFNTIYDDLNSGFLQIQLFNMGKRDIIKFILPERMRELSEEIYERIAYLNEIEYFLTEGFIDILLEFVPNDYFKDRKIHNIIDQRHF